MADLWYPWCSSGDDCCGSTVGHGNCFACGGTCRVFGVDHPGYDVPPGGAGGPLQWLAHCPATSFTCFGQSCAAAGGDHYLDYVSGCTWSSPSFTLCAVPGCYAWQLSIGAYPQCDPNPAAADEMRLQLVNFCGGAVIASWVNPAGATLTCNGTNTLSPWTTNGACYMGGVNMPPIDVEPIWTP